LIKVIKKEEIGLEKMLNALYSFDLSIAQKICVKQIFLRKIASRQGSEDHQNKKPPASWWF
jgi:hypothetical protein